MTKSDVSSEDVKRLIGDVDPLVVAEVVALGPTVDELEVVATHLAQATDVVGELRKPLTGRARRIYDMVRREEERFEEDR